MDTNMDLTAAIRQPTPSHISADNTSDQPTDSENTVKEPDSRFRFAPRDGVNQDGELEIPPHPGQSDTPAVDAENTVPSLFSRSPFHSTSLVTPDPVRALSVPNMKPRTPRPVTPRPHTGDSVGRAGLQNSSEVSRPLNVTDALGYLDAVKVQFQDKPDVYNHFLDIMKDFKSQVIDTPGVIKRVSRLFHGNPYLIKGFNTFLPLGYRIDISADPLDPNMITVTTPMGRMIQNTDIPRSAPEVTVLGIPRPLSFGPGAPTLAPLGDGSRSMTPLAFHTSHGFDANYSQVPSTSAAASFLENLSNRNATVEKQSAGEFNHAIQYLNKIKARYADDANTYKQFLEILQTYQKEQRHLQDSQVSVQVQLLFKDAPDLLNEFKDFLPDPAGPGIVSSGAIGILPQPPSSSSVWGQAEMSTSVGDLVEKPVKKAAAPANRRRKRPADKDTTPGPLAKAPSSRAKKPKHHHKPDPATPPFSPYQGPQSPEQIVMSQSTAQPTQQPLAQNSRQVHAIGQQTTATADELLFFDRAKKTLETREVYDEFLKLLNLYSKDIIEMKTLLENARPFLGDGDLMAEFKDLMGWDDNQENVEYGPPGSIRTGPPEAMSAMPVDDGEGPSYRRLPPSEMSLACSGRDQLCRSVLNDEWVSHPTWATEEAGFLAHKKNSFEEVLHKSEEERHEYHVHIEALTRTIAILDPLNARIEDMTNEERSLFRLKPDLGGTSKNIYHRIIRKVYGRDAGQEVLQALQDCPAVAVPVVLARLKQKHEEWRRAQREWSRTWREVDAKNFYKSLDHQGISFKANDKKNITTKYFVADIESLKANQDLTRAEKNRPACSYGSLGHQLEFCFEATPVLHDSLKLVYSFLDHSQAQYSPHERRSVEKFLRSFVPLLCMYPAAEFNAACGPLEGAQEDGESNGPTEGQRSGRRSTGSTQSTVFVASDLRKRLLKTAQEKTVSKDAGASAAGSRAGSPIRSPNPYEALMGSQQEGWVKEAIDPRSDLRETNSTRKPIFVNTTFYTLLRLLQLLYSRLLMCKEIGARLAAQKHVSFRENPIAEELGLADPNGPSAVLAQAMEAVGDNAMEGANVVYMYLLDACEKVFDNELDQGMFEEHMRWFFGSKAYHVFTLDKLITALIKQVQTILSDNKCQEIWSLLQHSRAQDKTSNRGIVHYRREAERHIGGDDPLYRVDWERQKKTMYIQLVGAEDPSVDEGSSAVTRWREYVDTYVMRHRTEWVKTDPEERHGLFLKRNMVADEENAREDSNMRIRISLGTYRLFYEAGTEDCLWRERGKEEVTLIERAKVRREERNKFLNQI